MKNLSRRKFLATVSSSAVILPILPTYGADTATDNGKNVLTINRVAADSNRIMRSLSPNQDNDIEQEYTFSNPDKRTFYIYAGDYILNAQSRLWGDENLVVIANHLTIEGQVLNNGNNIVLLANKITSKNGELVASGVDAPKTYDSGYPPSGNGTNGNHGGDGQTGNSVLVWCRSLEGEFKLKSVGGKGGTGQRGGSGYTGSQGANGQDGEYCTNSSGAPGGAGGQGGPAGIGGNGGNGGNGGRILISTLKEFNSDLRFDVAGGEFGVPIGNGSPGQGGEPGLGGQNAYRHRSGGGGKAGGADTDCGYRGRNSANGGRGPAGPAAAREPSNGSTGKDGTYEIIELLALPSEMVSISYLNTLLYQIQSDYWSRNWERAIDKLEWLMAITGTPIIDHPIVTELFPLIDSPSSRSEFDLINKQCEIALRKLELGLDLDGRPQNYVPLTSFSTYKLHIEAQLAGLKVVEENLREFEQSQENAEKAKAAILKSIESMEGQIREAGSAIGELKNEIETNSRLHNDLNRDIQIASNEIILNREAFERAFVAKSNGCTLENLIAAISAVFVLPTAAGAIVKNIGSSIDTLNSNVEDKLNALKPYLTTVKFESKNLAAAFNEVRSFVKSVTETNALIATSQEHFEEELKPYLDMPESKLLRDTFRKFASLCTSRNQKLLNLQGAYIKLDQCLAEIDYKKAEILRLYSLAARENSHTQQVLVASLRSIYFGSKLSIILRMNEAIRALEYYYLDQAGIELLTAFNHAALHASFLQITNRELKIRNDATAFFVKFTRSFSFNINANENSKLLASFKMDGHMVISLDFPEFVRDSEGPRVGTLNHVGVLASGIDVIFAGGNLKNCTTSISIKHLGQERFRNSKNQYLTFSREASTISIDKEYSSAGKVVVGVGTVVENNLTDNMNLSAYALRSLYSTYIVTANHLGENLPDWIKNVESIKVHFYGYQRTAS